MVCSGNDGVACGVLEKSPWSYILQNYSSKFEITKEKDKFYMKSKDAACDMWTLFEPIIGLDV